MIVNAAFNILTERKTRTNNFIIQLLIKWFGFVKKVKIQ